MTLLMIFDLVGFWLLFWLF